MAPNPLRPFVTDVAHLCAVFGWLTVGACFALSWSWGFDWHVFAAGIVLLHVGLFCGLAGLVPQAARAAARRAVGLNAAGVVAFWVLAGAFYVLVSLVGFD